MQNRIRAAGASFVAISPQTREKSREMIEKHDLASSTLRDEKNQVAQKFNRLNQVPDDLKKVYLDFGIDLENSNGEDSWTLPVPGTYVIDTRGVIRYCDVNADYTKRPEPEETVKAVEALSP